MNKFMQLTKDFINDEEGLTIVEYVIGAAALVLVGSAFFSDFFGDSGLKGKLDSLVDDIGS
ncbi:Flp family type IVb pilin [Vibrio algivorus]|uniref:Flp family type IVb pilin n=1 Tax=Vibrio algivorus TaxID=1667024 RepID=A0A557PHA3_9VIBR|nr:Flp family type IVb pilin [Vibrio algivorus]TVO40018.1 Flp family type IVb pilin [Vibrio algivorus]